MTCAYNELYLHRVQCVLGDMLHYAVYDLKQDLGAFYRAFINSGIAYRIGIGEPKYAAGMSGAEIAYDVIEKTSGEKIDVEPSYAYDKSPEYWAGWAVAYYEWCSSISFERIEEVISINDIVLMYHPYHEADITKFVDEMDKRFAVKKEVSRLARLRAYADLTQKALAERSGVSVRMIEQYEQGKKDINKASVSTIYQLSRALHCRMEELIG